MLSLNWPEMEDLIVPQVFKIGGYLVYFWINETVISRKRFSGKQANHYDGLQQVYRL